MISVICPIYNIEKYLKKCVESIRNQTYQELEIILVDDGSGDISSEMTDEYLLDDSRIVCVHKMNKGLSSARNIGIDLCVGWLLSFVDGDDYISPDMLEKMILPMIRSNADVSLCGFNRVDENGLIITSETMAETRINKREMLYNLSVWNVLFVTAWGKVFKRSIFDNLRFLNQKYHEDELIAHYIWNSSKSMEIIDEPLYQYSQRDGSLSRGKTKASERIDLMQALVERAELFLNEGYFDLVPNVILQAIPILPLTKVKIPREISKSFRNRMLSMIEKINVSALPQKSRIEIKLYKFGDIPYRAKKMFDKLIRRTINCIKK